MLALSGLEDAPREELSEPLALLSEVHHQLSDLLRDLPSTIPAEVTRLGLAAALEDILQNELKHAFDEVTWQAGAQVCEKAARLPAVAQEVLFFAGREAMRNAACHARSPHSDAPLCLQVSVEWKDGLVIQVQDNGVGMDPATPPSGGHGLALHSTLMAVVGGSLTVESLPGAYTRVQLYLPENAL
jgi:signal transduction histidine kinase